ncbi:MAG: hypothetical protein M5U12_36450 [Verrucomicrobia bacterium]|nr:hypothetical protein [Verrucomicrobiota bacterium]
MGLLAVALTTLWRWAVGDGASERSMTSVFVLPFRYAVAVGERVAETEQNLWLCGRITDAFIDGLALVPGLSPDISYLNSRSSIRRGLTGTFEGFVGGKGAFQAIGARFSDLQWLPRLKLRCA